MIEYICTNICMKKTGSNIRALRKAMHLTVGDVCEALGLFRENTVYEWERGEGKLCADNLVKLARLFKQQLTVSSSPRTMILFLFAAKKYTVLP